MTSTSIEHALDVSRPAVRAPKQSFSIAGDEGNKPGNVAVKETLPNRIRQRIKRPKDQLLKHRPPVIEPEEIDQSVETFMLDKPQLPPTMGKVDPILQAPKQIWYLRNKELGELGPLKGRLMQKRLDAGDITIGSLVWRGDWGGWIPAEKVFPSLVVKAEGIRLQQKRSRAFKELPIELRKPVPRKKKKLTPLEKNQRKNWLFAAFVISGVMAILVLLVVAMKIVIDNP
ncbi:DUF4339 domain-containing protein [Mariniblastus sp.]|nr:DUF4339 domain-containing protein [Mariniblastus sp.]